MFLRAALLAFALSQFSFAADQVIPPKLPNGNIFLTSPEDVAAAPAPATVWSLTVKQFRWLVIDESLYTGPLTLDGADNPAITIFPAKAGVEYPGWKEGDKTEPFGKAKLWVPPASKNEVFWVGGEAQGIVKITAWGIKGTKPVKLGLITLNVGGAPQPDPHVDPTPPKPEPTGQGAWVEVIEETANRTPDTIRIVQDKKFWDSLDAKGHATRFYDKDAKAIPKGHYKGDALPILLVVSKDGDQLYRGPLPKTTAEIATIVTTFTGVK